MSESNRNVKLKGMTDAFKKIVANMDYSSEEEFSALKLQTSRIHSFLQTYSNQKIPVEKSFVFSLFAPLANLSDKTLITEIICILSLLCLHNAILRKKFSKIYPNATNEILKLICNENKYGGDDDHFILVNIKLLAFIAPSDNKFTLKCRLSAISKIIVDLLVPNQASPSNLIPLLKIVNILSKDSVLCNKFQKLELVERIHSIFKNNNSKSSVFKLTLLIFNKLLKYKPHLEPFIQRRGVEDLLRFLCTSQKGTRISKVTYSTACVLNHVASIACGAEELQRLRVCDRLVHLLATLKSRPYNHSFIHILFDIMLKSATYHQPSIITSSSSCYKYPLLEKFSKKTAVKTEKLMSDDGATEANVTCPEDDVKRTVVRSPIRTENVKSQIGGSEDMQCFFGEFFILEDLIKQQTESSSKTSNSPIETNNLTFPDFGRFNDYSGVNQSLNNQPNRPIGSSLLVDVDSNFNNSCDMSNISNKYFKQSSPSEHGDSDNSENCHFNSSGDSNYDEDDEDEDDEEDDYGSGDNVSHRFIEGEEDDDENEENGCDVKIDAKNMSDMLEIGKDTNEVNFNDLKSVTSNIEHTKKVKKKFKNKVKRKKALKNNVNNSFTDEYQFGRLSSPLTSTVTTNNETKTYVTLPKLEDSKRGDLKRHLKLKPISKQSVEKKNYLLKNLSQSPYLHQTARNKMCKLDCSVESLLKNKVNNNTNADPKMKKEFYQSFSLDDCFSSLSNLFDSDMNGGSTSSFVSGSSSGGSNPTCVADLRENEVRKDARKSYQLINIDGEQVSIQSYDQIVQDQKKFVELASETRPAIHFSCIPHPDLHGFAFPPFEELKHEKTFPIVRKRLTEDVNRYFENANLLNKVVYDLDFLIKQKMDLTKCVRNAVNVRSSTSPTKQEDTAPKSISIRCFKKSSSDLPSLQKNDNNGVSKTQDRSQASVSKAIIFKASNSNDNNKSSQTVFKEDEINSDFKSFKKSQLQNNDLSIMKKHSLLFEKCYKACNYLNFDSKFECGNLRKAVQVREREYDLILNADINTSSHQQWFYFKVSGMEAFVDYRFNIVNCEKANSQFNFGMQPVMYSVKEAVEGRGSWCRVGKDVCYYKNHLPKPHSEAKGENVSFYHTCSFNINFLHSNDVCYIAYHYPYSYTKLMFHLHQVQARVRDESGEGAPLDKTKSVPNNNNIFDNLKYSNYSKFSLKNVKNKNNLNKSHTYSSKKIKVRNFCKKNTCNNNSQTKTTPAQPSVNNELYFKIQTLCQTLNGNDVPVLTITSLPEQLLNHGKLLSSTTHGTLSLQTLQLLRSRPYIVLTGRVHPGETNSSWMMQGTIDFLLSKHPTACRLREEFVFKVVPMLNPDGVINGNHRCSLTGDDLNRQWSNPSPTLHPTIYHTKQLLAFIKNKLNANIYTYCDFHGHSRKKNVFLYGCSPHQSWKGVDDLNPCVRSDGTFDHTYKIIPNLLSTSSPSFNLPSCSFSVERSKESTARVVVWRQFGVVKSYTMESTYSGFDQGPYDKLHVNPYHLEEMGQQFLRVLCKSREIVYEEAFEGDEKKSNQSLDIKTSFKLNAGGLSYELNDTKMKRFQSSPKTSLLDESGMKDGDSMEEFVPSVCFMTPIIASKTSLSKKQASNAEEDQSYGGLEYEDRLIEDNFKNDLR